MSTEESETERTTVMTYVPAYQKEQWVAHADELGMSQSEFVRTMVQAGRRDFEVPALTKESDESGPEPPASDSDDDDPNDDFARRVREALSASEYRSWDELLADLTDDIESRLDATLQELQASNVVQYSGRHGGYTLTESAEDANE